MNKYKWIVLFLAALLTLLLAANVLAMSSPGYALEWYVPVTGAGGGKASSANYAINFTIGQSVIGPSTSPGYASSLGYWYGLFLDTLKNLPIIFK